MNHTSSPQTDIQFLVKCELIFKYISNHISVLVLAQIEYLISSAMNAGLSFNPLQQESLLESVLY